jgi:choline-sulfatase
MNEPGWQPVTSPLVSAKAVRWLEERARSEDRDPFLLFLHYFDPHLPYVDHEAGGGAAPAAADDPRVELEHYRSEIAFTDRHLGAVLDALERTDLARDTAVVFFSDHGESFHEHPGIRRHSYSLYEEELRVPLVVRVPGLAPRRVRSSVRSVDVLPTLVELFGLSAAGPREGVSLVPHLSGAERDSPANLAEIRLKDGHHWNGLVRGRHKLVENVSDGRVELYDLETDPRETRDLARERADLARTLRVELYARIRAAEALAAPFGPAPQVEHTPEELENMEDLGYAGDEDE